MMFAGVRLAVPAIVAVSVAASVTQEAYIWDNVFIGGGGGFIPGIVFNPTQKGLTYARADIGGVYRLNADDSWTPLLDWANDTTWDYWGVDAMATDPIDPSNLYLAVGMYTNDWDPNNGTILKSSDQGNTFPDRISLPFKLGGNCPGRGMGERLVIDPNNNDIIYFGARSGNGLWRSTDAGLTWSNVTSFPSVGTYFQSSTDPLGSDIMGIAWITFDSSSANTSLTVGSSRIFVGVANMGSDNVFVSEDGGDTWSAVEGQNNTFIPHHGVLSPAENALYLPYANGIGPYDGTAGYVMKYFIGNGSWVDITPAQGIADNSYGYGGLAVDLQKPGTVMVAPLNEWYPDADIYRSTDGGATWTGIFTYNYPPPDYTLAVQPSYAWDVSRAPWITTFTGNDTKLIGWMIESLQIDPFDSDHWLYGTGLSLWGGRDLTNWDASPRQNVTVASLATGIEEMAVLGLTAPTTGPLLVSAVGDDGGFVHDSLTSSPPTFSNPTWPGSGSDVDFAGAAPENIVRLGSIAGSALATSTDGGATWTPYPNVPASADSGKIAISALGETLLWAQGSGFTGIQVSKNGSAFTAASGVPSGSAIASDKQNNTVFYAVSGSEFYASTDGGATFAQTATLRGAQSSTQIAVNPWKGGEVFVSTGVGVFYSTDFGNSFTALPTVTNAWSLAVGKPNSSDTSSTPTLFVAGTINGVNKLLRTDDLGENWAMITTEEKALGSVSGMVLAADKRTHGQVFVGTNGRGIFYGGL